MELFYAQHIDGDKATFDADETKHIVRSYRKREGDPISFTIGQGFLYKGTLTHIDKRQSIATVDQREEWQKPWMGRLQMAVAPTKNFNRIEWMVERMVEMGIDQITPITTSNSERRIWKQDRLQRLILAAAKQSLKCQLPQLDTMMSWEEFMDSTKAGRNYYIGHCEPGEKKALPDIDLKEADVCFCIGPEGDFSQEEIEQAREAGFKELSLGQQRLRTETAAMKMGVAFHIYNDWE